MAFFDKLNDLAKNIGDKTTDAIETTKLNSKITTEKSAAGEDLKKIGAFYYAKFAAGEEIEPSLLERFQSAAAHYAAAAEAQAEIDRIRAENEAAKAAAAPPAPAAGLTCPSCGTANPAGTRFCASCGARLEPPAPPEQKLCPGCGSPFAPDARFCNECGTRLE